MEPPTTHQKDHETEQPILLPTNRERCPWILLLSLPSFVLDPLFSYQEMVNSMAVKTVHNHLPCAQSCEGSYLTQIVQCHWQLKRTTEDILGHVSFYELFSAYYEVRIGRGGHIEY